MRTFGDEQSETLLKQYEENIPNKKLLKRMRNPIPDEEIRECTGIKRMKIKYDQDIDTTTIEDVEKVQQATGRNTRIDVSMIVYANQTAGCVIFTFLIPETMVFAFSSLDEDCQRDLADHGILRIEVNDLVIDLQSLQAEIKHSTSQTETKPDTLQKEIKTNTLHGETLIDIPPVAGTEICISQTKLTTDPSHPQTKTAISTYTTSGTKRVLLTHESLTSTHCNLEFQQLVSDVGTSLAEFIEVSKLKQFLQSFSHILYPEAQYIDPSFLKDRESVTQVFNSLQPQFINFLNWGILWKTADAFAINMTSVFQLYKNRFPPHTKLSALPDPLSEEEILKFKRFQKLRVTCDCSSGSEWTLDDVQVVRETLETATGIDQDFIIYAYWEEGFTTRQLTFLIPKSIGGIFEELSKEDLTILAGKGFQSLEIDYESVADNIQELYQACPQPVTFVTADNRMRTKSFGLDHFIPEDEMEQMSSEEFSHLNDLITSTPAGKLQETCSDDFLKDFAKQMGDWKDLAPYLGINNWDLIKLAEFYPGDEDKQKHRALLCWKEIDIKSATYERLVECLLTHGHVDDAKELLLQFQGQG